MNSKQRVKSRLVLVLIICGALSLASSLYWTQIMKGKTYVARADQQYVKPSSSAFDRGTIYLRLKMGLMPPRQPSRAAMSRI